VVAGATCHWLGFGSLRQAARPKTACIGWYASHEAAIGGYEAAAEADVYNAVGVMIGARRDEIALVRANVHY
jgi:hypothetical protein